MIDIIGTRNGSEQSSPFDALRQFDEHGNEYWSARDLMGAMGYAKWERFSDAIGRAMQAMEAQGISAGQHMRSRQRVKSVRVGFGVREVTSEDYHLTRYGCYLLFMNGDPRKPEVAAAMTYFVVKTREAELHRQELQPVAEMSRLDLCKALLLEEERKTGALAAHD
ncbi:MAG: BRO family protein [Corynebacterium variabile]|uniref:BRO family protein n=1 Tax=Corynebacterium variabile TaxID=1727 RepID=UPI003F98397D